MRTYLDCIPCFFRQALEGARTVGVSPRVQKRIMDEFAGMIPEIPLSATPPEIACLGYRLLKKIGRHPDPYQKIKHESNRLALALYARLKNRVGRSRDRLLSALELAIAGNVIDFGVKNTLNVAEELKKILDTEKSSIRKKTLFHYSEFKEALKNAKRVLYLADNAGETVFDRVLIEEIKRRDPEKTVYFAVKDRPIINDALFEDARSCGIDKSATIISNGSDAPGTLLCACSKEFKRVYRQADMIISKGQGNFESLSQQERPLFFLFMVKCPVVAHETRCRLGDIVLLHHVKRKGRPGGNGVRTRGTARDDIRAQSKGAQRQPCSRRKTGKIIF